MKKRDAHVYKCWRKRRRHIDDDDKETLDSRLDESQLVVVASRAIYARFDWRKLQQPNTTHKKATAKRADRAICAE